MGDRVVRGWGMGISEGRKGRSRGTWMGDENFGGAGLAVTFWAVPIVAAKPARTVCGGAFGGMNSWGDRAQRIYRIHCRMMEGR